MIPPALIDELRDRFRKGSTLPELLALAKDELGEKWMYSDAVRTAFALNPGGWIILDYTESFGNGKYPDRVMDDLFLAEILKRRPRWDVPANEREPAWYDGLKDFDESAADLELPTSPEGWAALGEADRERLVKQRRHAAKVSWYVAFTWALATFRQRRLNELEAEQRQPRPMAA